MNFDSLENSASTNGANGKVALEGREEARSGSSIAAV